MPELLPNPPKPFVCNMFVPCIKSTVIPKKSASSLMYYTGFAILAMAFTMACKGPMPKTVVYPDPANLHVLQGVSESPFFQVGVEEDTAFVYYGKDDAPDSSYADQGISFLSFEMSYGPVKVNVHTMEPIDSFVLHPFKGHAVQAAAHQLHVTFDEPDKLLATVYFEQGGEQKLLLSAEMPDWKKPSPKDKGVLYFGPGVHQKGENWNPFTDGIHTLYLEGGAVLEATLNVAGGKSIQILGRGIFAQAFSTQHQTDGSSGVSLTNIKKVRIEGITVLNSPGTQLAIHNADEVLLKNRKLCGYGEKQNDGLHLFSRNVIAEDLFVLASGNRIVLNGLYHDTGAAQDLAGCIAENIQLRDIKLFGVKTGADILLSRDANHDVRTVLIEKVSSLSPTSGSFVAAHHRGTGNILDVVIIDSKVHHPNLVDVHVLEGSEPAKLRSLYLDNIQVDAEPHEIEGAISGFSASRNVTDVIFTNISANGGMVSALDQMNISTNAFAHELQVRVEERDEY